MPTPSPLTKPKAGESVTQLWRDVVKLVDKVNAQQVEIAALKAQLAGRRPMDTAVGGGSSPTWLA